MEIQALYEAAKQAHYNKLPHWQAIANYAGINVNPNYATGMPNKTTKDNMVDDPTAAICVNQSGDYMLGIMWGTGDKVFDIIPSKYVLDKVSDPRLLEDWYSYATEQTLYHMNHKDAGFMAATKPYAYDQFAFGNSGVGTFLNQSFLEGIDDNALIFKNYGIDNTCIDEGKNNLVDYVFASYNWTINKVVNELCKRNGVIDKKLITKLPKQLQRAYETNDFTSIFKIVFGMYPRSDYNPKLKGKRGAKYKGVWFLDDPNERNTIKEEDFKTKPIAFARQIKIRGDVYGECSGTMLISTIRTVNFMVSNTIEIQEKMNDPAMGIFSGAVMGDNVIDTSSSSLSVFSSALTGGQTPMWKLFDVGDPTGIINFLIPYLNEKVITAFKVDSLLDFSSAKEMTATESLQRYAIRGKSLAGMLLQQKTEFLVPTSERSIQVLLDVDELGIDPRKDPKIALNLREKGKSERVIPEEVLQTMDEGKPWFELRFNNELEKMTRTEAIENLIKLIQTIGVIAGMYPMIIEGVDWYNMLKDINDNLDANNKLLIGEDEFKQKVLEIAQQQQQMAMLQAGQTASDINKNQASAKKLEREGMNGD